MNIRRLLTAFAVVVVVFIFSHAPAFAQGFAILLGGNEVSDAGEANVGDPDGSGTATLLLHEIDPTHNLCFGILVTGIDPPTLMHIHEGAAGVNGLIVVDLVPPEIPPETGDPGAVAGCIAADATVLTRIRQNPSGFYVNVHTAAFPNGAIRGQIFGSSPAPPPPPSVRIRSRSQ